VATPNIQRKPTPNIHRKSTTNIQRGPRRSDGFSLFHIFNFSHFFSSVFHQIYFVAKMRVEFLLKTDSGYPRDAEITLFTLANPEHSLRFNTHWSATPVISGAASRRFSAPKMGQNTPKILPGNPARGSTH